MSIPNTKTNLTESIQAALSQLENAYNPAEVEAGMYQGWEDSGYFKPSFDKDESFSIALPPPNVTGSLHTACLENVLSENVALLTHLF